MEDERAFANVLPDSTLLLWSKLLGRRGYQITDGEVILSPSKADAPLPNPKKSDMPGRPNPLHNHASGSVISSLRRVAPVVQANPGTSKHLPFRRSSSSATASSSEVAAVRPLLDRQPTITEIAREAEASPSRSGPAPSKSGSLIFAGRVFRALGEAKCPNVRRAIDELGGKMSTDEDEDVDFVIVRLVRCVSIISPSIQFRLIGLVISGSKLYREEDNPILQTKYRTECWLEQCIYEERICAAEDHVSFVPLAIDIPISGWRLPLFLLGYFLTYICCCLKAQKG